MTPQRTVIVGARVFDGRSLYEDCAAVFEGGCFAGFDGTPSIGDEVVDLEGDILCPGFVDLQVNGGGGVMFNARPSRETLEVMAKAHRATGTTRILPTLITDTAQKSRAAISAVQEAIAAGVPGIAGLHLEGPHLSVARKGAHDAELIRPMAAADLEMLLEAAGQLPVLKMTLAPENVSIEQVRALAEAGVLVSLGHSDADYGTCVAYAEAGARCATHLFNAMSQLGNREPGLVGAVLDCGDLSAGLIADGIHVHPAVMRSAWLSKRRPGRIFLVSDSMAVAGTDLSEFELEGRRIERRDGRLTLQNGTLAGADLDMLTAVRRLHRDVGVGLEEALAAATDVPARLIGQRAALLPSLRTPLDQMIRIKGDLTAVAVLS